MIMKPKLIAEKCHSFSLKQCCMTSSASKVSVILDRIGICLQLLFYSTKEKTSSPPGTFYILIGKYSYFLIRFLLNGSIVKSNKEIGKVNDKKI